jgi:hypothetical protein
MGQLTGLLQGVNGPDSSSSEGPGPAGGDSAQLRHTGESGGADETTHRMLHVNRNPCCFSFGCSWAEVHPRFNADVFLPNMPICA